MKNRERGFSILESLVAAAILVVTVLLVSKLVMNFKGRSRNLEGGLSCQSRAEAIVASLKNLDNKVNVSNFQPCPNCNPTPSATAYSNLVHPDRFENGSIPLAAPSPGLTFDKTNTWLLIDNGTNIALNLYNRATGGPDYCNAPVQVGGVGGPFLASTIANNPAINLQTILNQVNNGLSLNQEKDFLQVNLVDLTASGGIPSNVPCGSTTYRSPGYTFNQRILPLGSLNGKGVPLPETKLGIKIQSNVQYVDQNGAQKQCSASTILKADGNTTPPQFLWNPQYLFQDQFNNSPKAFICDKTAPYVCMGLRASYGETWNFLTYPLNGTNPAHLFCGLPGTSTNVHFAVAVNEPAITFACYFTWSATRASYDSASGLTGYSATVNPLPPVGAIFLPCDGSSFTLSGSTFTTTLSQVTVNPSVVNLPAGQPGSDSPTALNVSTGNVTAAEISAYNLVDGWYTIYIRAFDSAQNQSTVAQSFGVDNTRPDTVSPTGGSYNLIPPPNLIHYVPGPSPTPGLYQCQNSTNSQYWTATFTNSSGVPNVAPAGGIWQIDGVDVNNGKCNSAGLISSSLAPGPHTVSVQPCDNCNFMPAGGPAGIGLPSCHSNLDN